jgi:hypothetical protein
MIERPVSNPVSFLYYDWFWNFLNDNDLQFMKQRNITEFHDHINAELVNYNATFKFGRPSDIIVFENEQEATLFVIKWS